MNYSKAQLWERFQQWYTEFPSIGLAIDLSRMNFRDDYFPGMEPSIQKAFEAMEALEKGATVRSRDGENASIVEQSKACVGHGFAEPTTAG